MDASINQFLRDLSTAQDETLKTLMRFQLLLAQKIQFQTQENIKRTFGAGGSGGGKPISPLTQMARGASAGSMGRSGALMRSVLLAAEGGNVSVTVGGPGVPYAAIQEAGGTIKPVNAQFLTIPVSPKAAGKRAAEFNLEMAYDPELRRVLRDRSSKEVLFALRRSATLPARPYFQPAIEQVTKEDGVRTMLKSLFGTDRLGVEIV